jgi:hypothetical protein
MNQNESDQDIQDRIRIEHCRVQIQNHPNYAEWRRALQPFGRWVFDFIMDNDITPELVQFSHEAPEQEWEEFDFLRMVGGATPNGLLASTSYVLNEILDEIKHLKKN